MLAVERTHRQRKEPRARDSHERDEDAPHGRDTIAGARRVRGGGVAYRLWPAKRPGAAIDPAQ
jgi:hypothetical protein